MKKPQYMAFSIALALIWLFSGVIYELSTIYSFPTNYIKLPHNWLQILLVKTTENMEIYVVMRHIELHQFSLSM